MKSIMLFSFICLVCSAGPVSADVWHIETVDDASTGVGKYSSIALDTFDNPHISYVDDENWNLKFAYFNGSAWEIETISTTEDVVQYTSLSLDDAGNPHISFCDESTSISYGFNNGSSWEFSTYPVLALNEGQTEMALDSLNHPHISYQGDSDLDMIPELSVCTYDGSSWDSSCYEDLETTLDTSIALDSLDREHIAFNMNDFLYYSCDGTVSCVDSTGDVGRFCSIALDSSGNPHISYNDWDTWDLKYAYFNGSTWQIETIDTPGNVGFYISLAIDKNDHPHISYFISTGFDLKYAWHDGSDWQIESVDTEGSVGLYTSIAIDSLNNPHISYFDNTNKQLKYAWLESTVEIGLPTLSPFEVGSSVSNNPNPFSSVTDICFDITSSASVTITVYNLAGHLVQTLAENSTFIQGSHSVQWFAQDYNGNMVTPGIYFCRLSTDGGSATHTMLVVE